MSNVPFYKSKKFWTLVITIVIALLAYLAVGCTAQYVQRTHGVHIDTIDRQICSHTKNHSDELHW